MHKTPEQQAEENRNIELGLKGIGTTHHASGRPIKGLKAVHIPAPFNVRKWGRWVSSTTPRLAALGERPQRQFKRWPLTLNSNGGEPVGITLAHMQVTEGLIPKDIVCKHDQEGWYGWGYVVLSPPTPAVVSYLQSVHATYLDEWARHYPAVPQVNFNLPADVVKKALEELKP